MNINAGKALQIQESGKQGAVAEKRILTGVSFMV